MTYNRLLSICLGLLAMTLVTSGARANQPINPARKSAQPEILTLPPATQRQPQEIIPLARDPFNWSDQQLKRLRQAEENVANPFSDIALQAILWSPTLPQAVINDTLVQAGDHLDGLLILAINQDNVLLRKKKKTHTIFFVHPDINFGYPSGTTHQALPQEKANDN